MPRPPGCAVCRRISIHVNRQIDTYGRARAGQRHPATFSAAETPLFGSDRPLSKTGAPAAELRALADHLDRLTACDGTGGRRCSAQDLALAHSACLFGSVSDLVVLDGRDPELAAAVRQVRPELAELQPPPAGWQGMGRIDGEDVDVVQLLTSEATRRHEPERTVAEIHEEAHRRAENGTLLGADRMIRSLPAYRSLWFARVRDSALRRMMRRPAPVDVTTDGDGGAGGAGGGAKPAADAGPPPDQEILLTLLAWLADARATTNTDLAAVVSDAAIISLLSLDDTCSRVLAYLEGAAARPDLLPGVARLGHETRRTERVYPLGAGICALGLGRRAGLLTLDRHDMSKVLTCCVGGDRANGARANRVKAWRPAVVSIIEEVFPELG